MFIGNVPFTAVTLAFLVLAGCAAKSHDHSSKFFNETEFVGLKDLGKDYRSVKLDYELDGEDGSLIEFRSCVQVESTDESQIVSPQFSLFRHLQFNCLAAQYYHEGDHFKAGYLPAEFSPALIHHLPSRLIPNQGGDSVPDNATTLKEQFDVEVIDEDGLSFSVVLDGFMEVRYLLLARTDVTGDGLEDWIIRLDWNNLESFGDGTDLAAVTRTGESGPLEILRRHP